MQNKIKKKLLILLATGSITTNLQAISFNNTDELLSFVKSFLPEAPSILEAGGHFGEDTKRMNTVWPNATQYVFEPLPSSFEILLKETQHLPHVMCYPYALTSYSGKTHFYIGVPNNAASSIGYPVEWNQHEFDKTPIEIPCFTIDYWANIHNISHIDFMWLDMEGHELYALQHALKILSTVKAIYTEISFVPIREGSCLYTDLKNFLEEQGFYEVWKSFAGRFGDALFMRK